MDCNQRMYNFKTFHLLGNNSKLVVIMLNSKSNINDIVSSIYVNSMKLEQINVFLNYNCKMAKNVIRAVYTF